MGSAQLHQSVFPQNFSAFLAWQKSAIVIMLEQTVPLPSGPKTAAADNPQGGVESREARHNWLGHRRARLQPSL